MQRVQRPFSTYINSMLEGKYPAELRSLINAHLYDSKPRIDNLCATFEAEEMKVADLRALVVMAMDFAALTEFMDRVIIPDSLHPESLVKKVSGSISFEETADSTGSHKAG